MAQPPIIMEEMDIIKMDKIKIKDLKNKEWVPLGDTKLGKILIS
jgi:hypothetical protein